MAPPHPWGAPKKPILNRVRRLFFLGYYFQVTLYDLLYLDHNFFGHIANSSCYDNITLETYTSYM